MKHKFSIVYLFLVFGIILLGWGVFARLGQAVQVVTPALSPTPTITPNITAGADNTLQLQHMIAYRVLQSTCGADGCHIDPVGSVETVGRYLGGFVVSWRNCDTWQFSGASAPYTMTCTDPNTEGQGKFVSAFGMLISTEAGKLQLLIPLAGKDIVRRSIPGVQVPDGWGIDERKMMWTAWDIVNQNPEPSPDDPSTTYSYTWAGYVGGGCINSQEGKCGRVALEHVFILYPQVGISPN